MANFHSAIGYLSTLPLVPKPRAFNADFNTSQAIVQKNEGGYTSNPKDAGNWDSGKVNYGTLCGTNFGISAPVLKAYYGRAITPDDMKALPYATALQIYKSQYWNPLQLDSVDNQDIASISYDGAVNEGVGAMKKIVSDSLGGAYSAQAINNYPDQVGLFNKIKAGRAAAYQKIGGTFLSGWMNRLSKFVANPTLAAVKRHPGALALVIVTALAITAGIILIIRQSSK